MGAMFRWSDHRRVRFLFRRPRKAEWPAREKKSTRRAFVTRAPHGSKAVPIGWGFGLRVCLCGCWCIFVVAVIQDVGDHSLSFSWISRNPTLEQRRHFVATGVCTRCITRWGVRAYVYLSP